MAAEEFYIIKYQPFNRIHKIHTYNLDYRVIVKQKDYFCRTI